MPSEVIQLVSILELGKPRPPMSTQKLRYYYYYYSEEPYIFDIAKIVTPEMLIYIILNK